jgi:polyisoprenoid-binding protein YceI
MTGRLKRLAGVLILLEGLLAPASAEDPSEEMMPSVFAIDPARSEIRFVLQATKHHVVGRTREFSGSVPLRPGTLRGVEGCVARVDARTLDAGNLLINRQMRSRLGVGEHPEIRFRGRRFISAPRKDPDAQSHGELQGDLTIRGRTRPISIKLAGRWEAGELHAEGSADFKLTDFGIDPPRFLRFFRVRDALRVEFEVTAAPAGVSTP